MESTRKPHTLERLKGKTVEEGECWIWQGCCTPSGVAAKVRVD